MLRFSAIFCCFTSVLLGIAYNMQGLTPSTQILAALNVGMWIAIISYAVQQVIPWRAGTETLRCRIGSFLRSISMFNFAMRRRTYREWGKVFYLLGALVFFTVVIIDDRAPLYMNAVPPLIGATLVAIGWLVNHWPPSEDYRRSFHLYEVE